MPKPLSPEAIEAMLAAQDIPLAPGRAERLAPGVNALNVADPLRAKLAFERYPGLAFRLATTNLSWRLFQAVVRGDQSASDTGGLRGAPLRVLQALGA